MNTNHITFEEYKSIEKMNIVLKLDLEQWEKEIEKHTDDSETENLKLMMDESLSETNEPEDSPLRLIRDSLLDMANTMKVKQIEAINKEILKRREEVAIWDSILAKIQKNFELTIDFKEFEKAEGDEIYTSRLTTANSLIQASKLVYRKDEVISDEKVIELSKYMSTFMANALK